MARYDFGGTVPDYIFTTVVVGGITNVLRLPAGASLTFYSAKTGGIQYTDLRLASAPATPVSVIPVGTDGQIPDFQGPDGVEVMWATAGLTRVRMVTWTRGATAGVGQDGEDGEDGSKILWVTTEPATSLGVIGDWAFRNNGAVYEKTGEAVWTFRFNTGASGSGGTGIMDGSVTSAKLDVESIMDWLSSKIVSGLGTSVLYDDTAGTISINASGGGSGGGGSNWYVDPTNTNLLIFPDGEPDVPTDPGGGGTPVGVPGMPSNVVAVSPIGSATINVTWDPPSSDGGSPVTGYHVYRNLPDWTTTNPISPTTRTFTLTNFTFGTQYTVGVRALNALGPGPMRTVTVTPLSTAPGGGEVPDTPTDPNEPATAAAMALPKHPVGMYHMMYVPEVGRPAYPPMATTPANVNVLLLAFSIGDPPNIVGPSSEGSYANVKARVQELRARGVRIIMSYGGGGNYVNIANRQAIINNFMALNSSIGPLDGIDFDNEGNSPIDGRGSDGKYHAVYITEQLRALRGANFKATMAPNGTLIGNFLPVAKALQNAGLLGWIGQQFYDANVSDSAMHGRLSEAINTHGILPQNYVMGHMNPSTGYAPDSSYWTVDECIARMNSAWARYPGLAGAYYWERSRTGQTDWATRVGNLIKARP